MTSELLKVKHRLSLVLLTFLVTVGLALPSLCDQESLSLDNLWLGGTADEFEKNGQKSMAEGESLLIPDGRALDYSASLTAHFDNGKAKLISGDKLRLGPQVVVERGWSKEQVAASFASLKWPKNAERHHVVGGNAPSYDVWKFQNSGGKRPEVVYVAFSGERNTVGQVILKWVEIDGPFGRNF